MYCNSIWNREFADTIFPKSFRNTELKKRREDVLFQIEQSLLPDTQIYARLETRRRSLIETKKALYEKRELLQRKLRQTMDRIYATENQVIDIQRIVHGTVPLPDGMFDDDDSGGEDEAAAALSNHNKKDRVKHFIKKCPSDNCQGFLSSKYKCGLCETKICPKCHVVLKAPEEGQDPHVCDPNNVATVELLRHDSKPCPKCTTLIFKIDGCDQMWCTQCHTAFSWTSGRIETGRIHNPHWYEWQRRVNNGHVPREPGDIQGGGGCNDNEIPHALSVPIYKRFSKYNAVHRCITHIQHDTLPRLMGDFRAGDNRDLRIKYLLKELSTDAFKRLIQQREKRREKELALRQVLEMFVQGSSDIIRRLSHDHKFSGSESAHQLEQLREYTNECLKTISTRFTSKKYHVSDRWVINDSVME